jgi:hypothetical protein
MSASLETVDQWHELTCKTLDELRLAWRNVDECPDGAGVLSGGEYRALVFACGHERLLEHPVLDFLMLDGWLQEWVMRRRAMSHLVGMTVGRGPKVR